MWSAATRGEQACIAQVAFLFLCGERAVAHDALAFLRLVGAEQRFEEEMFLTSFLSDEARHVDFFSLFFERMDGAIANVRALPSYERILQTRLAPAVDRLEHDRSPEAQVRAAVTFHMVVEGVIAQANDFLRTSGELALRIFGELSRLDAEWIGLTQNDHQLPRKLLRERLQLRHHLQKRPIRAGLMATMSRLKK